MSTPHHPSITDVPGVAVGHHTDADGRTGVTVVEFPAGNVGAGEIRGAYPATREFETLSCGMNNATLDAMVFAGGSTHGLAAADGVVQRLEANGRGASSGLGPLLPHVASAVVYDLMLGDPTARPTAADGAAAYDQRSTDPVELGLVGAGSGTSAGKWRGPANSVESGIGSWSMRCDDATVGVIVVCNAVGDAFSLEGDPLSGGPHVPTLHPAVPFGDRQNTTLAALATDAQLDRPDLLRLLVRLHDAFGACLRPAHTLWDGDAAVAVSCGPHEVALDAVGEAAFICTARAIESAFRPPAGP